MLLGNVPRPGISMDRNLPSFLPTRARVVVAASRLALDLFREEKSRKTSGTRVLIMRKNIVIRDF